MVAEPLPGRRDAVSLSSSLDALQRLIGTARPDSLAILHDQWERVIGSRLAGHCHLHSLRGGTLVVAAADPGVAEQLRWLAKDLVSAANALLGSDEVDAVVVRVSAPSEGAARPVRGPGVPSSEW